MEYYENYEDSLTFYKDRRNTNPRYKHFRQTYFTAGDDQQFQEHRNRVGKFEIHEDISKFSNFPIEIEMWNKYIANDQSVDHTFNYMFHKFKKGVFIQIKNNQLTVRLPFSKNKFTNEWNEMIDFDSEKYSSFNELFEKANTICDRTFNPRFVNKFSKYWYANNALIRYEHPLSENDSGIPNLCHMFETLVQERKVPDIEFFINKRDFPILKKNATEAYDYMFGDNYPLKSHNYESYAPIFSMCSNPQEFADILIPTWDDWGKIMQKEGKHFVKMSQYEDLDMIYSSVEWSDKIETAIFRGSSTGPGIDIDSNPRIHLAYLSSLQKRDQDGVLFLDCGITTWCSRPRKIKNSKLIETINTRNLQLTDFKPLSDQVKYKYIINVNGHVCAYRLPRDLASGSAVLLVKSKYRLWFSHLLQEYVHYIPVKEDLSDLYSQIEWCKQHDKQVEQISQNAKQFYEQYLTKEGVLNYLQTVLWKVKKMCGDYNYTPTIIDLQNEEMMNWKMDYISKCSNQPVEYSWVYAYPRSYEKFLAFEHIFKNVDTAPFIDYQKIIHKNVVQVSDHVCRKKSGVVEQFVAVHAVNKLLKYIPNFSYAYLIDNNTIWYEWIDGDSLFDYLRNSAKFTISRFLDILKQVCCALLDAQYRCLFVHHDLFPWNIKLMKLDHKIPVTYRISPHQVINIFTDCIPVLIDYEKSHFVMNDIHYGTVQNLQFSKIKDILTLLYSSLDTIFSARKLNKAELSTLFQLVSFCTESKYHPEKIASVKQLRAFVKEKKLFTNVFNFDGKDLEYKNPLHFMHHLSNIDETVSFQIRDSNEELWNMQRGHKQFVHNLAMFEDVRIASEHFEKWYDKKEEFQESEYYWKRVFDFLETHYPTETERWERMRQFISKKCFHILKKYEKQNLDQRHTKSLNHTLEIYGKAVT